MIMTIWRLAFLVCKVACVKISCSVFQIIKGVADIYMLYLSVKYYKLINQENQLSRRQTNGSGRDTLSRGSTFSSKFVNSCLIYLVLWLIFSLSLFRISMRDIVIPISEWPLFYRELNDSTVFKGLINGQAFVFDFFDFLVAMISTIFFFRSGREEEFKRKLKNEPESAKLLFKGGDERNGSDKKLDGMPEETMESLSSGMPRALNDTRKTTGVPGEDLSKKINPMRTSGQHISSQAVGGMSLSESFKLLQLRQN